MLSIPKIDYYLEILTDEKVKDFVVINSSGYLKSIKEEQNLIKVSKSFYLFLTTPDEWGKTVQSNFYDYCINHCNVEVLNLFDPDLQLMNIKPVIKNKFQNFLSALKSLKFRQY